MPEKLPQPEENLSEKQEKNNIEPVEKNSLPEERDFNDIWNDLMGESELLNEFGYHPVAASEVKRAVGGDEVTMVEIPKIDGGDTAYVKPENIQAWIHQLRDKKELTGAKAKLENAYEDEGKAPENAEVQSEEDETTPPLQEESKEKLPEDSEINEADKEQLDRLKTNLYDLAEAVKKLYIGFSERDKDNFNPLIYPEDIGKLLSSAQGLENIADNLKTDESYLSGAISKITQVIEEIGNASQRGGVNEDEDSLTRMSYLLSDIENQCDTVLNVAGTIDNFDTASLRASVSRLLESTQDKRLFVGRKLEAFRDYNNS